MRTQLAKLAELRTGKSSRLPPTAPVPCPCLGMAAGAYPHSAGRPSLWRVTGTFLPATRGHDPGREECQPSARSRVRGRLNRAAGDARVQIARGPPASQPRTAGLASRCWTLSRHMKRGVKEGTFSKGGWRTRGQRTWVGPVTVLV